MIQSWPELHHFCHQRRAALVWVDLRQGTSDERITRKATPELYLGKIHAAMMTAPSDNVKEL